MNFTVTVNVEVQRVQGKFAGRDELGAIIAEAIESAEPDLSGLGADGTSEYEVIDWTVEI